MSGHEHGAGRQPGPGVGDTGAARTSLAGSLDGGPLLAAVDRLRSVPDRHREFRRNRTDARLHHGIPTSVLDAALDAGLPATGSGEDILFDGLDLANLSLSLRLPSQRLLAMRGWRATLVAVGDQRPLRYLLTVTPRCPRPGHAGSCRMSLAPQMIRLAGPGEGYLSGNVFHLERRVLGQTVWLASPAREVTDLVSTFTFHLLPVALQRDLGFLRDTLLADCVLAARYLVAEATARGIRSRFSYGIFLACPFSVDHCWVEFHIGGAWTAIDPHLLNTLSVFGLLDQASWPPYRSLGDIVVRVHGDNLPLATDRGMPALTSLPTVRVPDGACPQPPDGMQM